RIDGTVHSGQILMTSSADLRSGASVFVVEIGLFGGPFAEPTPTIGGTTGAAIGGSAHITATGNVVAQASSTGTSIGTAEGGSGGVIAGAALKSHASNSRTT